MKNLLKSLILSLPLLAISTAAETTNNMQKLIHSYSANNNYHSIDNLKSNGSAISKTVAVLPMGSVYWNAKQEKRQFSHTQFTPTGIFATKGSKIKVSLHSEADRTVSAFVGQWGTYANLNNGSKIDPKEYSLSIEGNTSFISDIEGMLYISNSSYKKSIDVDINIDKGINVPTFKVNETTNQEFANQLKNWEHSPFVEIIGKNVFGTFQMSIAKKLWINQDPSNYNINEVVSHWDQAYNWSNYVSGLGLEYDGVAQKYHNLIQIANPDNGPAGSLAYANNYYIGFHNKSGSAINLFKKPLSGQWALWHEIGHTYQNPDYMFGNYGNYSEVTVNINSLWIQRELGFKSSAESSDTVATVKSYIESPDTNKNPSQLDVWGKLEMFWQLDMAYGKDFYPTLNQLYRLIDSDKKPSNNEQKWQTFIQMTSKTVKRNLVPFFEKWGVKPSDETIKNVSSFPILTKPIWENLINGHDSTNPIVDYILPKYQVLTGVIAEKSINTSIGSQINDSMIKEYIKVPKDAYAKSISNIQWNQFNWESSKINTNVEVVFESSQSNITPNRYNLPVAINQENSILFKGINNEYRGIFSLDKQKKKFFITGNYKWLNDHFSGQKYLGIQVKNSNNQIIYNLSANGNQNINKFFDLSHIFYEEGYKVNFYFREPQRALYFDKAQQKLIPQHKLNVEFTIINNNLVQTME